MRRRRALVAICLCLVAAARVAAGATDVEGLRALAGDDGVVYAVDNTGTVVADLNGDRAFVPASTLKLFTCLLAFDVLGPDGRFATEFHRDGDWLVVRGRGDPLLVSEELETVADVLAPRLRGVHLRGVAIDDSFFASDLVVPGVEHTTEPYDALNTATAVNFNTMQFAVRKGRLVTGEEHTPLTSAAQDRARKLHIKSAARINAGDLPDEVRRYAAEVIAVKLRAGGVRIGEAVRTQANVTGRTPLYVHTNSRTIADVCRELLQYSNNYIANQLFLAIGAAAEGAPASLDKSVRAARGFLAKRRDLEGISVVEGSGIAYENRVTAPAMTALLAAFSPHRDLMKVEDGIRHKTGSLRSTKTLAGYVDTRSHGEVRFVIALDGDGAERRWRIAEALREM